MARVWIPLSLRIWSMFVVVAAISHIATTLWLASVETTDDFAELTASLTPNRFSVLETLTPETQRLPFMMPEAHYSVCPFDTRAGRVLLDVVLADAGWTLSLHAPNGTMVYYAPGNDSGPLNLKLVLNPPGDQFLGLPVSNLAGGIDIPELQTGFDTGVAVLRAPSYGQSYAAQSVNALKQSRCGTVANMPLTALR